MHTVAGKKKLIARVRRVRGQIDAVERALVEERGCEEVIRTISAARGAISALAAVIVGDHLREHVAAPGLAAAERTAAAATLCGVLREVLG